jgi:hypothetical protein
MNSLVGRPRRRLARLGPVLGLPLHEQLDRLPGAVPARVAVHRVVAPDDGPDAARARLPRPLRHLGEHVRAARGRGVAAVREGVDDEVLDPRLGGDLDQRLEVAVGGVHAAVGDEADQVHARRGAQRLGHDLVLGQRAVLDGAVDAREVLGDDRAGAEVEVADLGVAHLSRGQADRLAAGGELRVVVALPQTVEDRRVGQRDRVARTLRRQAPPVEDDQADGGDGAHRAAPAARSTMRAKDSGSRLAPPTSAPSTSGSASSSSALSGLSEPP